MIPSKSNFLLIACLVLTILCLALPSACENASSLMDQAEELYSQGKYADSIAAINKAIDAGHGSAYALILRGRCKRKLNPPDYDGAIRDLTDAIAKDPLSFDAYNSRGITYDLMKQYDKALADFAKAAEIDPDSPKPHYNIAMLEYRRGNYQATVQELDKAIELGPVEALFFHQRACAKHMLKDYQGAMSDYDKAIELDDRYAEAYQNRARLKIEIGNIEGAQEDFDKAASINPELGKPNDKSADKRNPPNAQPETEPAANQPDLQDEKPKSSFTGPVEFLPDNPDDVTIWNRPDTPWEKGDTPISKTLPDSELAVIEADFEKLDPDEYRSTVMAVMESMRLVYGEMTETETKRFEANWAPLLDYPTTKGFEYLNKLYPLIQRFLSLRSAIAIASFNFDKAWHYAGVAAGFNNSDEVAEALEEANTYRDQLVALKAQMDEVVQQITALGDPPNPLAARHRARKRLEQALKSLPLVAIVPPETKVTIGQPCTLTPKVKNMPAKIKLVWAFGDGKTDSTADLDPVSHKYEKTGNYTVSLKVFDMNTSKQLGLATAEVTVADVPVAGRYVLVDVVPCVKPDPAVKSSIGRVTESMEFHDTKPDGKEVVTGSCTIEYTWQPPPSYFTVKDKVQMTSRIALLEGSGKWTTSIHGFKAYLYFFKPDEQEIAKKVILGKIDEIPTSRYYKLLINTMLENPYFSHGPEFLNAERVSQYLPANQTWTAQEVAMPKDGGAGYPLAAIVFSISSLNIDAQFSYVYQLDPTGEKQAISLENLASAGGSGELTSTATPEQLAAEQKRKEDEERIATHRRNIEFCQGTISRIRSELSGEKDPSHIRELNQRLIDRMTEIQHEQDLIASIQTGTIVHTRSIAEEVQHAQLIESCFRDVQISKQIQENFERAKRFNKAASQVRELISLLSPEEAAEMSKWAAAKMDNEMFLKRDTQKLKQIASVILNKVQGQALGDEAQAMNAINTLEEIKFAASTALVVAAPFAAAQGVISGSYVASHAPSWIATGYGLGTGYIEGGPKQALISGARMYSGAVDVAVSAMEGYQSEEGGSLTGAAKHALLTLVLRKGCEMSANRIIQGRIKQAQANRSWKDVVEDANFQQAKKDGESLLDNYRRANEAFEKMVAARKPANQSTAEYLANNAAELSKTPEGKALCEALAQVESSYTAKMAINGENIPPQLRRTYNTQLETLIENPTISRTRELMRQRGWNDFRMSQIRHSANRNKVGRDHDLAIDESNWIPSKNGQVTSLAEFQAELNACLKQAYKETSGSRSARMADWKGTTSVDPEAYLDKAVLNINQLREQGIDPLATLNPQLAHQTAGVNIHKVKAALAKGSREGTAEACRTLSKEIDTKILPFMEPGTAQYNYFRRLKAALDKGSTDPRAGELEVYGLTGRRLEDVSKMVGNRLVEIITGAK
ncbi:MAG: tetratricopeptide repeat protein [Armatimonadetes bacterium]|nr:tetratricopeptide repeat protein [Armatimonadota bacterium]